MQSPTPAQHRVWFSTLSKCCKNAQKVSSPASPGHDRRPSLPYFMNAVSPSARRNSADPIPSTPKDQLNFLREITGQGENQSEKKIDLAKNLFVDIDNDSTTSQSNNCSLSGKQIIETKLSSAPNSTPRSVAKLNCMADSESESQPRQQKTELDFSDVKQATHRIHQFIKKPTQSDDNLESDPDCFDEVMSFHDESVDSSDIDTPRNGGVYIITL